MSCTLTTFCTHSQGVHRHHALPHPPVDPSCGDCPAGHPPPSGSPSSSSLRVLSEQGQNLTCGTGFLSNMLMTLVESLKNNCAQELSSGRATFGNLLLKTLKDWVGPMGFPAEIPRGQWWLFEEDWLGHRADRQSSLYSLGTPSSPLPQGLSTHPPIVGHAPCSSPHLFDLLPSTCPQIFGYTHLPLGHSLWSPKVCVRSPFPMPPLALNFSITTFVPLL